MWSRVNWPLLPLTVLLFCSSVRLHFVSVLVFLFHVQFGQFSIRRRGLVSSSPLAKLFFFFSFISATFTMKFAVSPSHTPKYQTNICMSTLCLSIRTLLPHVFLKSNCSESSYFTNLFTDSLFALGN
ncbi:hypothetical protein, unlikely [Trypanosoma brucei gambiense DAL972]|uniref:Uncharacterized protein n=1 Tax=Trypanosoma brucei gambiense (strain MHOM/CI/86/DAL972) TaxID=679716 RepID=C9ZSE5_TRYB9|nr:hypothetical protein, unlikely [Trypanosoma brucei gambiense DAL972]CBH12283.1 hypothetical protein, unlikely [Trypanosoma brucei gambiense DAL972]|eukprot:XP_011774564.1 hypothetical protein, unlikely [Trypanosoma brucei gambiense DAL972]